MDDPLSAGLTHQAPVLSSYKNQSADLQSKSIDWCLYEVNSDTGFYMRLTLTLGP